jgi:DNA-binding NtrC family response regulator
MRRFGVGVAECAPVIRANESPPLRVLVVDDEPLIRWAITETLEGAGLSVIGAASGQEATTALATASPAVDVVLLDYALPDSRHLDVLTALRRIAPATPVILMTVYLTPEIAGAALFAGACHVVAKPMDMKEVPALVRSAVRA